MEACSDHDVGRVQIGADFEEVFKSQIGKNQTKLIQPFKGLFQLYVLKLLKMQARYLGRQWRKSNMEIISAIYMNVRHRLGEAFLHINFLDSTTIGLLLTKLDRNHGIFRVKKGN